MMKTKLTVLVDIDNILNNFAQTFLDFYNRDNHTDFTMQDVTEYSFATSLKIPESALVTYFKNRKLLNSCEPLPDAIRYLRILNELANVYIVTAREFDQLIDIEAWFKLYYPYIESRQLIRCADKHMVKGDIRIDDHYKNLEHSNSAKILFNYPYNNTIDLTNELIYRVNNWEECFSACMLRMGYNPSDIDKYKQESCAVSDFGWNCTVR